MPSSLPAAVGASRRGPADCRLVYPGPRRLGGVAGINEGLTLMESLLVRQGEKTVATGAPGPDRDLPHLSKRLRQVIRTLNLTPEDVESLEQAERSLQSFDAVLQRLEIAPENQLSEPAGATAQHGNSLREPRPCASASHRAPVAVV